MRAAQHRENTAPEIPRWRQSSRGVGAECRRRRVQTGLREEKEAPDPAAVSQVQWSSPDDVHAKIAMKKLYRLDKITD